MLLLPFFLALFFLLATPVVGKPSTWGDWQGHDATTTEHTAYETIHGTTTTTCTTSLSSFDPSQTAVASPGPSKESKSNQPSASSLASSAIGSTTVIVATSESSDPAPGAPDSSSQPSAASVSESGNFQGTSSSSNGVGTSQSADSESTGSTSAQASTLASSGSASGQIGDPQSSGSSTLSSASEQESVQTEQTSDSSAQSGSTPTSAEPSNQSQSQTGTSEQSSATTTDGDSSSDAAVSFTGTIQSGSASGSMSTSTTASTTGSTTGSTTVSTTSSSSESTSESTPAVTSESSGSAFSSTDDQQSSSSVVSSSLTTETITSTSTGSDTTLITVIITTHIVTSNAPFSDSGTGSSVSSGIGSPPATPSSAATVVIPTQSATCQYDIQPWCTAAPNLPDGYGCLCPYCWLAPEVCQEVKPTDTLSCPDAGWVCAVTTLGSIVIPSPPPGSELITSAPSTSRPWWDYISTLHDTDDDKHTSDAHFNATLKTSTKIDSDYHTTLIPYRAWECLAGPVCFPPDFDFGCLFPNPLACAGAIGTFFGIWPRPKIPFPPPIGPPELNYQLETSVVGGEDGGHPPETGSTPSPTSPTGSESASSSECSSTVTFSTCSALCSTVTISSSATESCSFTCHETSGCSGSDSATTSTAACSISPYWDDPEIESSLSSLLSQFPFSFGDEVIMTTNITSGPSSTLVSSSATPTQTPTSTSTSSVKSSSRASSSLSKSTSKSDSKSSSAKETSGTAPAPFFPSTSTEIKSTSTKDQGPARTEVCHDYAGEFDYVDPKDISRHASRWCVADASPKGDLGLFNWDLVAGNDDSLLESICQSLYDRDAILNENNAECYIRQGKEWAEGANLRVLFRVSKSLAACRGDGTQSGCKDDRCGNDFAFRDFGVKNCVDRFRKLGKCQGKTWDNDSGEYDSAGGTYYDDCVAWTIVAQDFPDAPGSTEDTD